MEKQKANPKIIEYIKDYDKKGFSHYDVKQSLIAQKWSEEEIEKAFGEVFGEAKIIEESDYTPSNKYAPLKNINENNVDLPEKTPRKIKSKIVLISIMIVAIILTGIGSAWGLDKFILKASPTQ